MEMIRKDPKVNSGSDVLTEAGFEVLFKTHFKELHNYAFSFVKDWEDAEEIIQSLFFKFYEKNIGMRLDSSIRAYLYKSAYHQCLNFMRSRKVKLKHEQMTTPLASAKSENTADRLNLKEVERHLQKSLEKLPEKCRTIFHLSRFEELKYQEIADQLEISIKTVETHMVKALRILRVEMKEFLPLITITLIKIIWL